ncbi:hypothetical protein [Staphylococcus aureus]
MQVGVGPNIEADGKPVYNNCGAPNIVAGGKPANNNVEVGVGQR